MRSLATIALFGILALAPQVRAEDFIRGDANNDEKVDIADSATLLAYVLGVFEPTCLAACDANDDDAIDIADPIFVLSYIFVGGPAPAAPYPDCAPQEEPLPCIASGCP